MFGLPSNALEVFLGPAFLQTDNLWDWAGKRKLSPNFCQSFPTIVRYVLEAQTIVGDDIEGGWSLDGNSHH